MGRTLAESRSWMAEGTALFIDAAQRLTEEQYDAPCLLPGWSRKHLVAHVAANAEALGNLVHWAATGQVTPMYASPEERAAGINRGQQLSADQLAAWLHRSAASLFEAMDRLDDRSWQAEVITAQGRTVPATETPWMRAREVLVHSVDMDRGITFADLPAAFNAELSDEIRLKRGIRELPSEVATAPQSEITAWLAGRPHTIAAAPEIGPWL